MLKIDRLSVIETKLKEEGSVIVGKLSRSLNVTEETIRRDLAELEDGGKLIRVRGGAYLPDSIDRSVPVTIRESLYQLEKNQIASSAMQFVSDRDTLLLDSSTTALQLAVLIKEKDVRVTIITNSLKIAELFSNHKRVKLISLGGNLNTTTNSFVGKITLEQLANYRADICFISSSGVEIGTGLIDTIENESFIRREMIRHSKKRCLIIDHTKLDDNAAYITAPLAEMDYLITDKPISQEWLSYCEESRVEVIVTDMDK